MSEDGRVRKIGGRAIAGLGRARTKHGRALAQKTDDGTTMGRCQRNPLTRKRQVGAVCPSPTAELVDPDRDSSLWIAYSLRDIRSARAGQPRHGL